MRRLDQARALIREGAPLADAALASGFADQSHMTRHFKKAYGVSPGRWAKMTMARLQSSADADRRRFLRSSSRRGAFATAARSGNH
jgi:AraC-like DNA-binding protein